LTTHYQNKELNLVAEAVSFEAAVGEEQAPALRRFTMTAYTGGPMNLTGWRYPVVVDLQGMQMGKQRRPILLDHTHDVDFVLGQTDAVAVLNNQLIVTGQVMGDSPKARQVIALNDRGFAWQASIGARADQVEFVAEGKSSMVNGQEVSGPVNIARRSTLGEVSFVVLGADDNTSAQIAASQSNAEDEATTFEGWLIEHGFDEAELQAAQRTLLEQLFKGAEPQQVAANANNTVTEPEKPAMTAATEDQVLKLRRSMATELNRIEAIRKACGGRHPDIEGKAITEGWEPMRAELEVLRLDRPKAPAIHSADRSITTNVLEAACMMTARHPDVESQYDEKTLETATRRFRGGIGLQELLLEAAWANGYSGRTFRDNREVLRFAFHAPIQAGLSTVEVAGILSNVANKFLLDGFFSVERVWRNICAVRNVSDFKTVSSYRLIGKDQYELVAPGGEIQHGTLGEEKYQNKADTYGLLLAIDRRDIINDDLGAITTVPRKLGRGSGLKINDVFWTTFLNNATFFTAGNKNFLSGANTVLGIDSMTLAETAFMDQVDSDNKPIGVMPMIALVPTALSAPATQLYKSLEMRDNTANARTPISNPHQGKYRVEVSRYLGNAAYAGSSTKAWYLMADAADLPLIEVAFLNGQESPTIETAEADFNVLGVQMRGFHDFGVSLQDFRAAVKVKGEV
jgi:phage head maturation protease